MPYAAQVEISTADGVARAELEWPEPARPRFLLALTHGAGGKPDSADLRAVAAVARRLGGAVALVTQPYRVRGQRIPGSAARQDAAWAEIVTALRERAGQPPAGAGLPAGRGKGLPLIQGGRSNGARVACRTARAVGASAVIALAFPLHPPGRPGRSRAAELREAELREAGVEVLVVNGDRDPFGIPEPAGAARVVVLPGESHALSRDPEAAARVVESWLPGVLAPVSARNA